MVGNAEECVEQLSVFVSEFGIPDLVSWAVPLGLRPERMVPSQERFVCDVAPPLWTRFGGPA
ncbi:MAG: hypothetical protein EXR05_04240 [Acetobacteraceae bacterium]|nr:hypothetical protein [Acetobacteraceae bacterium]